MQHIWTVVQHDGPNHLELWLNQVLVPAKTVSTPCCQQPFCGLCLVEAVARAPQRRSCPMCRTPFPPGFMCAARTPAPPYPPRPPAHPPARDTSWSRVRYCRPPPPVVHPCLRRDLQVLTPPPPPSMSLCMIS